MLGQPSANSRAGQTRNPIHDSEQAHPLCARSRLKEISNDGAHQRHTHACSHTLQRPEYNQLVDGLRGSSKQRTSRKMPVPISTNHLRPNWSESFPTTGIMVNEASTYAVTTHVYSPSPCNEAIMRGIAVPTIA